MQLYQKLFQRMMEEEKSVFDAFGDIHNRYRQQPQEHQEEFNKKGSEVLDVIRRYEQILCGKSENSQYGKFSSNLSQKFWQQIRAAFPKIDFIGVKIS